MNNKNRIKKKNPSISIITISQFKRFSCLLNLYELIKLQHYKNIIEWVVVEGSHSKEEGILNSNNIKSLMSEE